MTIYSHSRLSTFENCPLKFRYKYLDKIVPVFETSIEAHLGKSVHAALEWLYHQVRKGIIPDIDEVIIEYNKKWEKNWDPSIKNVKKRFTTKEYFNKGINFILDYYMKNKPFEEKTLGIEKRIVIDLDKTGKYKLQGYIDRLAYNLKTGEYEIHDYKTSGSLPEPEHIENDRQLGLYSLAIEEEFGSDKEITLIWHYLAFNRKIHSKRTKPQLEKLKKETIELINRIETAENFPPKKSYLCSWCEYKEICPLWNDNPPKTKEEAEKILRKKLKN